MLLLQTHNEASNVSTQDWSKRLSGHASVALAEKASFGNLDAIHTGAVNDTESHAEKTKTAVTHHYLLPVASVSGPLVGLFSDEKSTPQMDICCLVVRLLPGPPPKSRKPN